MVGTKIHFSSKRDKICTRVYALYNNKIQSDVSAKIYILSAVGVQRREG